jgi:hypothetical protein
MVSRRREKSAFGRLISAADVNGSRSEPASRGCHPRPQLRRIHHFWVLSPSFGPASPRALLHLLCQLFRAGRSDYQGCWLRQVFACRAPRPKRLARDQTECPTAGTWLGGYMLRPSLRRYRLPWHPQLLNQPASTASPARTSPPVREVLVETLAALGLVRPGNLYPDRLAEAAPAR